ncbi:MAG: mandelate racemase/muconate lactonizing enzyme family protein [Clostridia bacterium]
MDPIKSIHTYALTIPRDVPYLGPLGELQPTQKGYFIRPRNQTVYSIHLHSVLVKVETHDGIVGYGEALCPVAPQVPCLIIRELFQDFILGRDPQDAMVIYEDLYDMMRVRGYWGGFYTDAIAALDIALWDIKGKQLQLPIHKILGSRQSSIPAYVSGLPKETLPERAVYAAQWKAKGFSAVKFAAAVANEGELQEMAEIRKAVGDDFKILADLHWRFTAPEAVRLIRQLNQYNLYLAEAPVHPQDIQGQAFVAQHCGVSVGIGEELRNIYEFRDRLEKHCMDVIQPEIGRIGISGMYKACQLASSYHAKVMPHASIGVGLFQAASLQVSATVQNLPFHEYQHSIFDEALRYLQTDMSCEKGMFHLPTGIGLGAEPDASVYQYAQEI